ncbi:MAG: hypothetical protein ABWY54_03765 [Glaciihabitans sp.]
MGRIVVALIGVAFLEAMGVLFVLGRNRLAKNVPPRALDGRPATPRSVAASGIGFMVGGAIVLIAVFVVVAAGS